MRTEDRLRFRLGSRPLLRVALWGGLVTIAWILAVIVWFDVEARAIWAEGRRESAELMSDGLVRAIQTDLATRNYAQLENHLKQAANDSGVQSVLVADIQGKVLSHVVRDPASATPRALYGAPAVTPPQQAQAVQIDGDTLVKWARVDSGVPVGWLRLELLTTKADAALSDLRWRFSLALGIASLMLLALLFIVMQRASRLLAERESGILAQQEALSAVAYRDSLTGLPNRHYLLDHMAREMARCTRSGERLVVCFMDLDGFKDINDRHGHEMGDEVLREVGRRLAGSIRESDTVARLGGDEFVLLLSGCVGTADCELILGRIQTAIRRPIVIGEVQAQVSSSIGLTIFPDDGSEPKVLLEHADQAMYEAKRAGKNRWRLYEEIDGNLQRRSGGPVA